MTLFKCFNCGAESLSKSKANSMPCINCSSPECYAVSSGDEAVQRFISGSVFQRIADELKQILEF